MFPTIEPELDSYLKESLSIFPHRDGEQAKAGGVEWLVVADIDPSELLISRQIVKKSENKIRRNKQTILHNLFIYI